MRRNWIGTIVLVGVSMIAGLLFSQIWEQVQGQNVGFSAEQPPQVVVKQPAELPKWCVNFTMVRPGVQVITIVDTETKRIAVYREDLQTGELEWLSTRNIEQDLMFDQHNALPPLPTQILKWSKEMEQSRGRN